MCLASTFNYPHVPSAVPGNDVTRLPSNPGPATPAPLTSAEQTEILDMLWWSPQPQRSARGEIGLGIVYRTRSRAELGWVDGLITF
jgi:hypothetical protein